MKKIGIWILIGLLCIPVVPIQALEEANTDTLQLAESAKSVVLLESTTGEIIYERNAHEKLHPASMTKMMGMLLIMEGIDAGVLKWADIVTVSENASSMGGSQILLETNEKITVEDLFKGVAIASGNDAIVALGEKVAGSEAAFVDMMNQRAKELGLENTNFKNPHGLDAADHYSTAYDMAMIAKELVKHEKVLEYTSIYEYYLRDNTDRKTWLVNTNRLIRFYDGMDGLKTGYTKEAGYCLTATAKRDGMRIIATIMGEPDSKTRNQEMTESLDYMFAQYELETLVAKGESLGQQEIAKAKDKYVEIVPLEDVTVLNRKVSNKKESSYEIQLDTLDAPVKQGDVVGTLSLKEDGKVVREIPITVKKTVEKANVLELYWRYLKDILSGQIHL